MNEVVRGIISGGARYSAVDAFQASYKLEELRRVAHAELAKVDLLALPTTGTIYTHEALQAEPVRLNTNLGYYTNFVNLLDLAAVAVPAGFRPNGLPFGISLVGPAFSDQALLAAGSRFLEENLSPATPPGSVLVAVVGAHLSGQPLNWQLTQRRARLSRACRTAACYRLYALAHTQPPKPGLVRDDAFSGKGIEVEVWAVPEDQLGGFVAAIPPPLSIGNAQLETGEWVKCFLCEPQAVATAREITELGGWRNYLAAVQ